MTSFSSVLVNSATVLGFRRIVTCRANIPTSLMVAAKAAAWVPAGGWGRRLVIHRVGAVSYALPPFLDLLGRVNRSPSRFKWNFVRLWKSMKPRVYENPHRGGTRDPRRDNVRIPKQSGLMRDPPF